jgi:hypothetical protein
MYSLYLFIIACYNINLFINDNIIISYKLFYENIKDKKYWFK